MYEKNNFESIRVKVVINGITLFGEISSRKGIRLIDFVNTNKNKFIAITNVKGLNISEEVMFLNYDHVESITPINTGKEESIDEKEEVKEFMDKLLLKKE